MSFGAGVVRERLDLSRVLESLMAENSDRGGGAIACFVGFVKGRVDGKRVQELEYSAYEPHASKKLSEIAREELERRGLLSVHIYHRVGKLRPGEPTLYVIVVGRSRREALRALEEIVERVKREPPIFKLERREDGEYWIVGEERVRREER